MSDAITLGMHYYLLGFRPNFGGRVARGDAPDLNRGPIGWNAGLSVAINQMTRVYTFPEAFTSKIEILVPLDLIHVWFIAVERFGVSTADWISSVVFRTMYRNFSHIAAKPFFSCVESVELATAAEQVYDVQSQKPGDRFHVYTD